MRTFIKRMCRNKIVILLCIICKGFNILFYIHQYSTDLYKKTNNRKMRLLFLFLFPLITNCFITNNKGYIKTVTASSSTMKTAARTALDEIVSGEFKRKASVWRNWISSGEFNFFVIAPSKFIFQNDE